MLYREIMAVCYHIHTKLRNTLCGQNLEFLNVKSIVTYGTQQVLTAQLRPIWLLSAVRYMLANVS